MSETSNRGPSWSDLSIAPPGFTDDELKQFSQDGFITLKDGLSESEVARYLSIIDELVGANPDFDPNETFKVRNLVGRDRRFEHLIDDPRHIGYIYELFGEMTKLVDSEAFLRPPGGYRSAWHIDGPTIEPYHDFVQRPVNVRVAYWLTELPGPECGNLIYRPGSVGWQTSPAVGRNSAEGEVILHCKPGTVTLMDSRLWHRVDKNHSPAIRKNIFLTYAVSWLNTPYLADPVWASSLTRERRIIVRPYANFPSHYSRPPALDVPLYLTRDREIPQSCARLVFGTQSRVPENERWLPPSEFRRLERAWLGWFDSH